MLLAASHWVAGTTLSVSRGNGSPPTFLLLLTFFFYTTFASGHKGTLTVAAKPLTVTWYWFLWLGWPSHPGNGCWIKGKFFPGSASCLISDSCFQAQITFICSQVCMKNVSHLWHNVTLSVWDPASQWQSHILSCPQTEPAGQLKN